jgi:NADPH:quinone reductase-like Zn-dependent oxidoreductase
MRAMVLPEFGIDKLQQTEIDTPTAEADEVLVRFQAASLNSRDQQIVSGAFAPGQPLPIIPVSDGAGVIEAVGAEVVGLVVGDRVCPTFFPEWVGGEALADERKLSSGLEAPGVLRDYGAYKPHQLVTVPANLSLAEAACLPCAGLTAWTSLVNYSSIGPGDWVLVQGTGGVSLFGLQFAKALGANVIVTSGSDDKLEQALELGADHGINYLSTPEWGEAARELAEGLGVHAVLEVGGTGTLQQSVAALRRGGHINVIGYFAGIDLGLNVFHLIERNAHVHGLSVGNREAFDAMCGFIEAHKLQPVIGAHYAFDEAAEALQSMANDGSFGKIVIDFE